MTECKKTATENAMNAIQGLQLNNLSGNQHIHGIGTDIADIGRIKNILKKYPDRFKHKVLSEQEIEQYQAAKQPNHFFAKRWACKEAFVKALGTGFRGGILMTDISVRNDKLGKPLLSLTGVTAKITDELNIRNSFLSLSDEHHYALSFVVLTY